MIVLTSLYGQRSNNLFQHIHLESFCRENNLDFYNPELRMYTGDYKNLELARHPLFDAILFAKKRLPVFNTFQFLDEAHNDYYKQKLLSAGNIFCRGWCFRSFETTIKYRTYYKKIFEPNIAGNNIKHKYLNTPYGEKIIGVHIRRGDYHNYAGGRFLYDDSVYISVIQQLLNLLNTNNYKIIILTNDVNINANKYRKHFENIQLSEETELADQYILSKCDYIIGPPSTFSLWASYIGEVPYHHIVNSGIKMSLQDFVICNG